MQIRRAFSKTGSQRLGIASFHAGKALGAKHLLSTHPLHLLWLYYRSKAESDSQLTKPVTNDTMDATVRRTLNGTRKGSSAILRTLGL